MLILKKRWILTALVCLAVLIASPLAIAEYAAVQQTAAGVSTSWGLSFQKEGETPVGNADAAYLKQFDAYYVGNTSTENGKTLYLTFDAGFENGNTAPILDALKKHNAKATFFLVKNYLDTAPDLVKRMVAEGHTVGNHTASHPDMSKIADRGSFQKELTDLEDAYRTLIGKDMEKLYRPPQGERDGVPYLFLEFSVCGLVCGPSADPRAGTPKTHNAGTPWCDRAVTQYLCHQRADLGRIADKMGIHGLSVCTASRIAVTHLLSAAIQWHKRGQWPCGGKS